MQVYLLKNGYYKTAFWLFEYNTIKYCLTGENVRPVGTLEIANLLPSDVRVEFESPNYLRSQSIGGKDCHHILILSSKLFFLFLCFNLIFS